jgi:hypothetical protein
MVSGKLMCQNTNVLTTVDLKMVSGVVVERLLITMLTLCFCLTQKTTTLLIHVNGGAKLMSNIEDGYYWVFYVPDYDDPTGIAEVAQYLEGTWYRIGRDNIYEWKNIMIIGKVRTLNE